MNTVRVGVIGYGLGGSIFHAPLVQAVAGLELAAVVTSQRERVEKDFPGMRVVPTTAELFADPNIDLVVVASPSTTHFEVTRGALEAGKHAVVDKPFAASVREAEELISLAAAKGLFLSVYQNRRWDGDFLTVKDCIRNGSLGEIFHYEAHFDRFRLDIRTGWKETGGPGSGILYDLGSHLIDQALQLFGLPHSVTADVFAQRKGAIAPDYFHLILEYGKMRAILHASTLVRQPGPHFSVHGDAGSFIKYGMDGQEPALIAGMRPGDPGWAADAPALYGELTSLDGTTRRIPTIVGGYEHYYEGVAAALSGKGPNPVDPSGARDGLIVIEAALRSAAEKRTALI
jgi:scyllo-inositol 2-dehydrogenase (NADP+)